MRLGVVAQESANAYYRVLYPMMAMQHRGHEVVGVVQEVRRTIDITPLAGCDLVQIHRPALLYDDGEVVTRLLETGAAVGFDEDDSISEAPQEFEAIVGPEWLPRARRNFELLLRHVGRVDLVSTPSERLADRFEEAGAVNLHVIDNYLPRELSRVRPVGHEGLVIGWHAAGEHAIDADRLGVADVLRAVLDAHPDVHVVTLHVDLGIDHERYTCERPVPFERLTQRLADFDVGLVPLLDIPFNHGRSNVKAREYAAAGVPWLASPVGPYEELGEEEGGRLVEDAGWFDALDELIRDQRARARQAQRAAAWGQRETLEDMAGIWEQVFQETIEDVRSAA